MNPPSFYYNTKRNRENSLKIPVFSENGENRDKFTVKKNQMKINNFFEETEAKSPIKLKENSDYYDKMKEMLEMEENQKKLEGEDHKEIEKLEKSGILNWDASETRFFSMKFQIKI